MNKEINNEKLENDNILSVFLKELEEHERLVLENKRKYTKEQIIMDVLIANNCFRNYTIFEDRYYLEDAFEELLEDYNISEDEVIKLFLPQLKIFWNSDWTSEKPEFYEKNRLPMKD